LEVASLAKLVLLQVSVVMPCEACRKMQKGIAVSICSAIVNESQHQIFVGADLIQSLFLTKQVESIRQQPIDGMRGLAVASGVDVTRLKIG
jgi:hypothetical protein